MEKNEYDNAVKLIDEGYKNVRMATFAIDCIIDKIENKDLENLLRNQNSYYLKSTKTLESLAEKYEHEPMDINPFLKGSSFASIKLKTVFNNETPKIAEMLVQGTTMGITDSIKAKSEHPTQDEEVINAIDRIINYEEEFVNSLKKFL